MRFSLLLIALILPVPGFGQHLSQLDRKTADRVDADVHAEVQRQQAVGVAVGVVRNGQTVYLKGYGFADREGKTPIDAKTLFRWASVSKPVTAVAAMQLWEQGKLDLDADVRKLVPEFPDCGDVITAKHLLCHQSGIVHYAGVTRDVQKYESPHPYDDVILALDTFKKSKLLFKPGEKYGYSTHAYILLSAVVQRVGQQKFADQVQDRIAKPAGMTTFQPDYQWKEIPGRAIGYCKVKDEIVRSTDTDVSWKLGGGGFISNIDDMARFAAALANGKLVKKATEEKMWTALTAGGKPTNYGLGFGVQKDKNGQLTVSHGGAQEKTRTHLIVWPATKNAVVVMSNCEYVNPAEIAAKVEAALK